jgi:transketolase
MAGNRGSAARARLAPEQIAEHARSIRRKIIRMNANAGQGHTGADLSETDILATLFFNVLDIDRERPDDPDRDRFILSKGHGIGGFYCMLSEAGYLDEALLETYLKFDSPLPGHPVRQKTPAIEINTGALGHGLSVGVGLALAGRLSGRGYRVFVLTGDGELQEGSVWEAAMSAARFGLANLVVIVDRNTLQLADRTEKIMPLEPLADKWKAFGFDVHHCDGHDPAALIATIAALDTTGVGAAAPGGGGVARGGGGGRGGAALGGKPHVIIAKTTKGKGVSFIEDQAAWHHKIPVADQVERAIQELE